MDLLLNCLRYFILRIQLFHAFVGIILDRSSLDYWTRSRCSIFRGLSLEGNCFFPSWSHSCFCWLPSLWFFLWDCRSFFSLPSIFRRCSRCSYLDSSIRIYIWKNSSTGTCSLSLPLCFICSPRHFLADFFPFKFSFPRPPDSGYLVLSHSHWFYSSCFPLSVLFFNLFCCIDVTD